MCCRCSRCRDGRANHPWRSQGRRGVRLYSRDSRRAGGATGSHGKGYFRDRRTEEGRMSVSFAWTTLTMGRRLGRVSAESGRSEELREKTPRATRRGRRRRDGERQERRGENKDDGCRGGRSEVEVGATRWKASWPLRDERALSRESRVETARGQTEQLGPGGAAEARV